MPTPTSKREWQDEYTLLCERCGYVIEGLDTSGNCPECGKPIAESLPQRRVGTPWQRSPGVGSLVRTWWVTLRHPLRTLDVMRVRESRSEFAIATWTIIASSLIISAGLTLPAVYMISPEEVYFDERFKSYQMLDLLVLVPMLAIVPLLVLPMLTWIETRGLIIIGKTRGFRIDKRLARTITAHGCAGWLLMAVLYFVLMNAGSVLIQLNRHMPDPGPRTGDAAQGVMEYVRVFSSDAPRWTYWLARVLWASSLLTGFLFFETFAYLGLRRCKFANRVPPESTSLGATTRVEDAQ